MRTRGQRTSGVLALLRAFAVPLLLPAFVTLSAQSPPHLHKDIAPIVWHRCCAVPSPWRDRSLQPAHLRRCAEPRRRRSRAVTARADHAAVETGRGKGDFHGRHGGSPTSELGKLQQLDCRGRVRRRSRAIFRRRRLWSDGWQLGDARPRRHACRSRTPCRADGGDLFRTFVHADSGLGVRGYVRAIEFRPGNARVVHHANIWASIARARRGSSTRAIPNRATSAAWCRTRAIPKGRCSAGRPDRRRTRRPTACPGGSSREAISSCSCTSSRRASPNRCRCRSASSSPTRRRRARPLGLRLGSETIDIPAGDRDYVIADRYVLPVDVELLAIQPHAHNLARRMEANATLPDGTVRPLIAIADWDFRWQDVYRYATPVALPEGHDDRDALHLRQLGGERAQSASAAGARRVGAEHVRRDGRPVAAGRAARRRRFRACSSARCSTQDASRTISPRTRSCSRAIPTTPLRHDAVGDLLLQARSPRRGDRAVPPIARRSNPASASTHYNLGYALVGARTPRRSDRGSFARRSRSIPTTRRRTTISARFCRLRGDAGRGARAFRARRGPASGQRRGALTNLGLLLSSAGSPGRCRHAASRRAGHRRRQHAGAVRPGLDSGDRRRMPTLRDASEAVALAERAVARAPARAVAVARRARRGVCRGRPFRRGRQGRRGRESTSRVSAGSAGRSRPSFACACSSIKQRKPLSACHVIQLFGIRPIRKRQPKAYSD